MTDEAKNDIREDEATLAPTAKKDGDKSDKFRKDAAAGVNKIFGMLDKIGELSNRSKYDYTDDDVAQIFTAIDKRVKETKAKFSKTDSDTFSFK